MASSKLKKYEIFGASFVPDDGNVLKILSNPIENIYEVQGINALYDGGWHKGIITYIYDCNGVMPSFPLDPIIDGGTPFNVPLLINGGWNDSPGDDIVDCNGVVQALPIVYDIDGGLED